MAGKIKALIDEIVDKRANGKPFLISITKAKLALKGVDPEAFNESSDDDIEVLNKLKKIAVELGCPV